MLRIDGVWPCALNPLVEEEKPAWSLLATVSSPKSVALPVEAIVTKSITFDKEPAIPAIATPRVELEPPPIPYLASVKSPKSEALPSVEKVT